jgi:hypothetical protein
MDLWHTYQYGQRQTGRPLPRCVAGIWLHTQLPARTLLPAIMVHSHTHSIPWRSAALTQTQHTWHSAALTQTQHTCRSAALTQAQHAHQICILPAQQQG